MIRTERGNREGFLKILTHLYKRLRGYTIHLFVDRARLHKGEVIEQFLATHQRLHLECLPAYPSGLNMQERIWRQVRYESKTNQWFADLDLIFYTVRKTIGSWSSAKIRRLYNID